MDNISPVPELSDEDVFGVDIIEEARGRSGHASFLRTAMSSGCKSEEADDPPTPSNSNHPEHTNTRPRTNYVLHGIPSRQ